MKNPIVLSVIPGTYVKLMSKTITSTRSNKNAEFQESTINMRHIPLFIFTSRTYNQ